MKNKKAIMFFSSLLILIFHLWINIFDRASNLFEVENFLRQLCYIGVDIFFFLSCYSISKHEIKDYKKFICSRFIKIYLVFILFTLIWYFYSNLSFKTFLLTISGIQLFIKGGGSFLWFIPAIMIIYILLPLFNKVDNKYKIMTPIITVGLWLIITIILSTFNLCNQVFIFSNRIPIMLLGCYCAKYHVLDKLSLKQYILAIVILLVSGIFILYQFNHITFEYINDIFYLLVIPLVLGLILLVNLVPSNRVIDKLGSVTLEMYGIQMIFGFKIASRVFNIIKNPLLSNVITIIVIILLSLLLHYVLVKIIDICLRKCSDNL